MPWKSAGHYADKCMFPGEPQIYAHRRDKHGRLEFLGKWTSAGSLPSRVAALQRLQKLMYIAPRADAGAFHRTPWRPHWMPATEYIMGTATVRQYVADRRLPPPPLGHARPAGAGPDRPCCRAGDN